MMVKMKKMEKKRAAGFADAIFTCTNGSNHFFGTDVGFVEVAVEVELPTLMGVRHNKHGTTLPCWWSSTSMNFLHLGLGH
jgi:hypothetical protein